jgi:hypothetical protein
MEFQRRCDIAHGAGIDLAELAVKRPSADYLNAMRAVTPPAQLTPVALPARTIDPPTTISAEARAALSFAAGTPVTAYPAHGDLQGWQRALEASAAIWDPVAAEMLAGCRSRIETQSVAGVTLATVSVDPQAGGRKILIGGSSAGGNLAAAVTLLIRDRGLEPPAAVILLTPEAAPLHRPTLPESAA